MEKLIEYTPKRIEQIVREDGTAPDTALLGLYRNLYTENEWKLCSKIEGYPKCSKITVDTIIQTLTKKFPDQKQEIMMMWVNMGFSVDDEIPNWKVKPAELVFCPAGARENI